MLRSLHDLHGLAVQGSDGAIGRIVDLYFDDQAWTVRFLVVETGDGLEGRKVLISPMATGEPDSKRRLLPVSVTRKQVARSPDIVRAQAQTHRQRGDDPHLRSARTMVRYHLRASDGGIGRVDGMIVDDDTWAVRYLVVNTSDWWLGHQVLVAPSWVSDVSWLEATVSVDLSRQAIKHAPAYDPDAPPDREQEQRLHDQHARPGYWSEHPRRDIEPAHREVRAVPDAPLTSTAIAAGLF